MDQPCPGFLVDDRNDVEPRAALGHYDAATGRYTLYAGSGGAVRQKSELVQVLGIAPENLRVLSRKA